MYPTGILKNTKTGRFHPIPFRMAILPGGVDAGRYKSIAHHTSGFDTIEQAKDHIAGREDFLDTGKIYDWDGEGVPAMVEFFTAAELERRA